MTAFTKTRRMTGAAGVQTIKHRGASELYTITGVTVNGSAATYSDVNGLITITSPTLVGGEAVVLTETWNSPSIPAPVPVTALPSVNVVFTKTQNGAASSQTFDVVDQTGKNPAYAVTGTIRTNR